jgi:hypothetical protein
MPEFLIKQEDEDEKQFCENNTDVELYQVGVASAFSLSKFSGKSTTGEQKKDMLKKRATVHFNKEIKERKHQMWKDTFNPKQ